VEKINKSINQSIGNTLKKASYSEINKKFDGFYRIRRPLSNTPRTQCTVPVEIQSDQFLVGHIRHWIIGPHLFYGAGFVKYVLVFRLNDDVIERPICAANP
jgi:hypothetical protein